MLKLRNDSLLSCQSKGAIPRYVGSLYEGGGYTPVRPERGDKGIYLVLGLRDFFSVAKLHLTEAGSFKYDSRSLGSH